MLIEYIERLRKEPVEVRRQAVGFWTVVCVGIIVLIYFGVLFVRESLSSEPALEGAIAAPYEAREER